MLPGSLVGASGAGASGGCVAVPLPLLELAALVKAAANGGDGTDTSDLPLVRSAAAFAFEACLEGVSVLDGCLTGARMDAAEGCLTGLKGEGTKDDCLCGVVCPSCWLPWRLILAGFVTGEEGSDTKPPEPCLDNAAAAAASAGWGL